MPLAKHHEEHTNATIGHPRAYELFADLGFAGRRRLVFTQLAALTGARPGDRVLDVGCGTGYLTRRLAPLVAPGGEIIGVDPAPQMADGFPRTTSTGDMGRVCRSTPPCWTKTGVALHECHKIATYSDGRCHFVITGGDHEK